MPENAKPSDDFMDAVCNFGTPSADCGFCGVTHFATGHQSCNSEQEIAEFRKKASEKPDRYQEHPDYDSLGLGIIEGRQVVWGCPCNKVYRYEQFIWNHKEIILEYLARKTKSLRADVENTEAALAGVKVSHV